MNKTYLKASKLGIFELGRNPREQDLGALVPFEIFYDELAAYKDNNLEPSPNFTCLNLDDEEQKEMYNEIKSRYGIKNFYENENTKMLTKLENILLNQHLTDFDSELSWGEVMEALKNEDYTKITVWQNFEDWEGEVLAEHLNDLKKELENEHS